MFKTEMFQDPQDVDAKLAALNLDKSVLIEALLQANLYRVRLTSNHPFLYRCAALTCETVAALRDLLIPRGWQKRDEGHYELVINTTLNMGIAVASGNEWTGNAAGIPSNRSEKGPRTARAVKDNQTSDLFPETLPPNEVDIGTIDTWILLHRLIDNELHVELSRPNGYDITQRFVTSWSHRILLGSIPLDNENQPLPISELPDVDIIITRKVA